MAIAWGPKGQSGSYLVEVDGQCRGFVGMNAARDAKRYADLVAGSRGKVAIETVYPGPTSDKPAPAKPATDLSAPSLGMPVTKLTKALATGDLDAYLDGLEAGEKAKDKPRPGALKALAARRALIAE